MRMNKGSFPAAGFVIMQVFCILLISLLCMGALRIEEVKAAEEDPADQVENKYFCFFLYKDMTKLETESYEPEQDDTEFMLRDLMQLLGSKKSDGKELNLLPEEVTINSFELQNGVLAIDFNAQYKKMSRVREILVRAGVVKTFMQVPEVEAVRFTVAGEDLTDSKNQPLGEMNADTFVEYSEGTDVSEYRFDTLLLYFTDQSGTVLIPEQRNVYYRQNLQKERVVLEQLARGPMVKGNFPTLPGNVEVQSVTVSDGICYVSVDDSFVDYALSELPEEIPIYSVVNSIIASCGETKVELTSGSNANRTFGESMDLYRFYEFDPELVSGEQEN